MKSAGALDVLIVSLGSTEGLRRADLLLHESLSRAGVGVELARAERPPDTRTLMLTDLAWARAARAAALAALRRRRGAVGAVIYSSTTAALLWPRPGVIRFDATSAANRPGRNGLWQRPLERRRLAHAPLLLPWSEAGLREAPPAARRGERALVLPVPVAPSRPTADGDGARDIAAITYAANPAKKGLERVLAAWRTRLAQRSPAAPEELIVTGVEPAALERAGLLAPGEPGIRAVGRLAADDYRAVLRRARVFVCAPRREDYGIAQLEALAEGCQLVTTPAPGPYAALPLARALDERLVDDRLELALHAALEDPAPGYSRRAQAALAPFSPAGVDRLIAEELLPRLLA
jgi:glycosyltransferase involved in cell wall biosynthesis